MKQITPQNTIFLKPAFATLLFILLVGFSCASKKGLTKSDLMIEENPKLIFLNYTISEDNHGVKTIRFINKTITEGKLRSLGGKYIEEANIGDLKCSQLNKKSQIVRSTFVKDPLNKTMEFINDSMQFERKSLKLKKTSLSIRLQLHPEAHKIEIAEIIDTLQNVSKLYHNKLK